MTERQELLEMRLDALVQDIDKVKQAIEAAKRRGVQLQQVRAKIGRRGTVIAPLSDVKTAMSQVTDILRIHPDLLRELREVNPDLPGALARSLKKLDEIRDGLLQANDTLDEIGRTYVDLTTQDKGLQKNLNDQCTKASNKVKQLKDDLKAHHPPREVWRRYEELLDDDCKALFAEYVDFLGGITLRDTALDDGVCSMTDQLLGLYVGVTDKSLAVPAHREPMGHALRSLVKLGFPEWTTWSVPLVGYDVGLAIAETVDAELVQDPGLHTPSVAFQRRLLADAFAVYSLGLAYAAALMTLRLQPHHDDQDPNVPSDIERARLALEMLRLLESDLTAPLAVSTERLSNHWSEAVKQLSPIAARGEAEELSPPAPADLDWLTPFASAAFSLLRDSGHVAYDAKRFAEDFDDWKGRLTTEVPATVIDAPDAGDPLLSTATTSTVRDAATLLQLLNCAWSLRLGEPDLAGRVARNLHGIWACSSNPSDRVPKSGADRAKPPPSPHQE